MNAANIGAPLEGVVAAYQSPVVDHVDIRLAPDPRLGSRVANERTGEATVNGDCDLTAGECLPGNVYAGDANGGSVTAAIVVGLSGGAIMGKTNTHFSKECRREYVIVVQAGAVGLLISRALKAASLRSAQKGSEGSRLEGDNALPAVTAAEMVLFVQRVIALAVEAVGGLGEG